MNRFSLFFSLLVGACGSSLPPNPCGELVRVGGTCVCPDGSTPIDPWRCELSDGGIITAPNAPDGSAADAGPNADAGPSDPSCVPSPEVCNGRDDDCSGAPDDAPAFECVAGSRDECTTECGSTGTRTCDTGSCVWRACTPPVERCNYRDDDCDGLVDPNLQSVIISTDFGDRDGAFRVWVLDTTPITLVSLYEDGVVVAQHFDAATRSVIGDPRVLVSGQPLLPISLDVIKSARGGVVVAHSERDDHSSRLRVREFDGALDAVRTTTVEMPVGYVFMAQSNDTYLVVFEASNQIFSVPLDRDLAAGTVQLQVNDPSGGSTAGIAGDDTGFWLAFSRWPGGLFLQRLSPAGTPSGSAVSIDAGARYGQPVVWSAGEAGIGLSFRPGQHGADTLRFQVRARDASLLRSHDLGPWSPSYLGGFLVSLPANLRWTGSRWLVSWASDDSTTSLRSFTGSGDATESATLATSARRAGVMTGSTTIDSGASLFGVPTEERSRVAVWGCP